MRCSAFGGQPCQWPCAPVIEAGDEGERRRPGGLGQLHRARSRQARTTASVPEVADAGEHHRDAALVGGGDHFVVAHRAARLDHARRRRRRRRRRGRRGTGRTRRDATTEPGSDRPAFSALIAAMRAESTRLIWPAPTPSVMPSRAEDDRVGLDELGHAPGEQQVVRAAAGVGARLRHDLQLVARRRSRMSAVCISRPQPTRLTSQCVAARRRQRRSRSTRTFAFFARSRRARRRRKPGAISTSTNCLATASRRGAVDRRG